jgi:PhzF family phenazine biosynthesis protein
MAKVLRYAAFTRGGEGGNPAGVVLDADDLEDVDMQRIAAEVGYSETAFLRSRPDEPNVYDVRYFAPEREVPFCGHATIAAAVALAEREPAAEMIFHTPAGLVTLNTEESSAGVVAELTSVAPRVTTPPEGLVDACLDALHWAPQDLDPSYPPMLANAGAEHLIVVVRTHERLLDLDYDFDALADIMAEQDLITLQLVWPKSRKKYFVRNPFPSGGVVEDPATGAAAAAFGGYLRELGKIGHTASFTIWQGAEIGRPSEIEVSVIEGEPGVRLRGLASEL